MPWISVEETKKHLNKRGNVTIDDDELTGFINAACSAIEDVKGHVDVVTATLVRWSRFVGEIRSQYPFHPYRRHMIELLESPVLTVQTVNQLDVGGTPVTVPPADPDTGVIGWTLLDTVLFVPQRGHYEITYQAGRSPVPPNIRLAALELVGHLWRGSQLNQNSGRPPVGGDQMMVLPHMASAMPYRVRELLGLYGNVVNDHVVIA